VDQQEDQAGEDLKWEDGDLEPKDMSTNVIKPKGMEDCKNAVEYFKKMFDKGTFQLLLEMNIHHLDVNKKIRYVKIEELRKAIGILMYCTCRRSPAQHQVVLEEDHGDYCSFEGDVMICHDNRFEKIVRALHISNNHLQPAGGEAGYDKLYKVRKLLDMLNKNFRPMLAWRRWCL
jgi:hypothetical protein